MSGRATLSRSARALTTPRATTIPSLTTSRFASSTPSSSSSSSPASPLSDASSSKARTTHFGFREIPEEDKETLGTCIRNE